MQELKFLEGKVRIELMTMGGKLGDDGAGNWRIQAVYAIALMADNEVAKLLGVDAGAVTMLRKRFGIPRVLTLDRYCIGALLSSALDGRERVDYEFAEAVALRMADTWAEQNLIGKTLFVESLHSANFSKLLRKWLKTESPKMSEAERDTRKLALRIETREALGEN